MKKPKRRLRGVGKESPAPAPLPPTAPVQAPVPSSVPELIDALPEILKIDFQLEINPRLVFEVRLRVTSRTPPRDTLIRARSQDRLVVQFNGIQFYLETVNGSVYHPMYVAPTPAQMPLDDMDAVFVYVFLGVVNPELLPWLRRYI